MKKSTIQFLNSPHCTCIDCSNPDSAFFSGYSENAGHRENWHLVKWPSHGHGANLFAMAWVTGNHWDRGIPTQPSNSHYRFSEGECGHGWSCFMSPMSKRCVGYHENSRDSRKIISPKALLNARERTDATASTMDHYCYESEGVGIGVYNPQTGRCDCPVGYLPSFVEKYKGCRGWSASYTEEEKRMAKWIRREEEVRTIDVGNSFLAWWQDAGMLAGSSSNEYLCSGVWLCGGLFNLSLHLFSLFHSFYFFSINFF